MSIPRLYSRFITGLAICGAASYGVMTLLIALDVLLRNTGFRSLVWSGTVVEYLMLFATMAAAPWLVRIKGHISINSLVGMLPPRLRAAVGTLVTLTCIAVLALLAWRAFALAAEAWQDRSLDLRTILVPAWILPAMLCGGFALLLVEFLRLLVLRTPYASDGKVG